MLSIADILTSPLFAEAQVVAGHKGLLRQVLWVHNAGVPDAPAWLNGGELVMTTMINLPPDRDQQCEYLRQMVAKQVAGLVMTVGKYIEHIPQHLRQVADENDFPLIEIPYTTRFVDIAKTVNERISHGNLDMVRHALTINQQLTQIVLEGGGLKELAQRLASLVRHSISIESATFDAIATVNIADVDEARRYTQTYGRTDPRLVEALETRGYLPKIRETLRPVRLPIMTEVGLEMERMLAPVVVHGMVYGYMWIIADNHALSEIDQMAIESGATIAALMILYQESAQTAENSLKGSLLTQLIQGDTQRETILTDQSLRYGVDLRLPFVMALIDCDATSLMSIYRQMNQLASMKGWSVVVGQFAGQVVVLVQASEPIDAIMSVIAERLNKSRAEQMPRMGVSGIYQGAHNVRKAHQMCRDVLAILRRLYPNQILLHFGDLGYLHTLYQAGAISLRDNPYVTIVRTLLEERPTELFQTLEAYLDAGGNGVLTAEKLHIHRSTLNYRLTRITQLCAVDIQEPFIRTNLQVALKLLRLFEVTET
jgi:PucR family transcriptional regulator, purine catabolism regulatory protein